MSKLAGGPWPASLELEALSLPPGYVARHACETDRGTYVELSHETLGRYARDLHGLADDAIRTGLHDEFQPQLAIVVERGDERIVASTGAAVTLSVVDGNAARELYQRLGFIVTRIEPPRTFMEWRQA